MGILSKIFGSVNKSNQLTRIARVLDQQLDQNDLVGSMIRLGAEKNKAEQDLLELIESDANLVAVMSTHGASNAELLEIHNRLRALGYGWVNGHYIPVSAIAYQATLDYLLRSREDFIESPSRDIVVMRVVKYFKEGETGIIR